MNKLVKDALILTIITLVAGGALGLVHEITLEPIARANEAATQEAYQNVFADADSFEAYEGFDVDNPEESDAAIAATKVATDAGYDADISNAVVALDASGNELGYVITVVSHGGYGGDITFSVGITMDGIVNGYSVTSIDETPGLGMHASDTGEGSFSSQFEDVEAGTFGLSSDSNADDVEIDSITGATFTSSCMTNGVNAAVTYATTLIGGGN